MGGFKFLGNNGFQSTLPRVERQRLFLYLDIPGNFNPRSREWSDPLKVAPLQVMPISIHAPASGATTLISQSLISVYISIHAPASGATEIYGRNVTRWLFQSTLPRVERQYVQNGSVWRFQFQSTLPRVERHKCSKCEILLNTFQSTLPRVERRHLLTFFRLQYGYILFHLTNKYSFCF